MAVAGSAVNYVLIKMKDSQPTIVRFGMANGSIVEDKVEVAIERLLEEGEVYLWNFGDTKEKFMALVKNRMTGDAFSGHSAHGTGPSSLDRLAPP